MKGFKSVSTKKRIAEMLRHVILSNESMLNFEAVFELQEASTSAQQHVEKTNPLSESVDHLEEEQSEQVREITNQSDATSDREEEGGQSKCLDLFKPEINITGSTMIESNFLQLKCLYTPNENVTRILTIFIEAEIGGVYVPIANFFPSHLDLAAALSDAGTYLSGRVVLTNPILPDINGQFEVIITYNKVTCEDDNSYICRLSYIDSEHKHAEVRSQTEKFIVKGSPNQPDDIPSRSPDSNICPGDNVTLICSGNIGKLPGNLKWTKFINGTSTTYTDTVTSKTEIPGTCLYNGTSMLTFEARKEDNNAIFRCEVVHELATNDMYQERSPGTFVYEPLESVEIIKVPDRLYYDPEILFIDLTCSVQGCYQPTHTWVKDPDLNVTIGNESLYRIFEVTVENSGIYICISQIIDNGTEYNQTQSVYIGIRQTDDTKDENGFVGTLEGIITVTLASVAGTILTSFAVFKIIKKAENVRKLKNVHVQDEENIDNNNQQYEETINSIKTGDDELQLEVSQ
ncbi:Hypothetical predicted protein [Mytilus galloprovincialis]|uniref:Ig-like domain-containing protein n=1 Tax=Mytilus galloprovincialis TaxID=29158 RepID=A0A8B6GB31_MYTGA|nr:Hypothetical predicted protein [Mytilus galloprovincialis]